MSKALMVTTEAVQKVSKIHVLWSAYSTYLGSCTEQESHHVLLTTTLPTVSRNGKYRACFKYGKTESDYNVAGAELSWAWKA